MSLPVEAIDRLFKRLSATYGAAWDRSHGTAPMMDVKTAWSYELSGFGGARLSALAWALENLPERCPNVIEFRNLARKAPVVEAPKLPEAPADPGRVRAELARLLPAVRNMDKPTGDRLHWARKIVARFECGEHIAGGTLQIARAALAVRLTPEVQQ